MFPDRADLITDSVAGPALWRTAAWQDTASAWLDDRLAAAGRRRTGPVSQPHLRPWATALRADTDAGPVWLKAAAAGTAFEIAIYSLLPVLVPDRVLIPLAVDRKRGWVLLPDGGKPLRDLFSGSDLARALAAALSDYGRFQVAVAPAVPALLAAGVPDMRPAVMPDRLVEALAATATSAAAAGAASAALGASAGAADTASADLASIHRRVVALRDRFAAWCDELADTGRPAGLDHNDLHPANVLEGGRFFDWGDAVIAHPFAACLVPLGVVRDLLPGGAAHPDFAVARDGYLAGFGDPRELHSELDLALRVAKAARVLTWERALAATRLTGDPVPPAWAAAPLQTLGWLLDESPLPPRFPRG